MQLDVNKPGFNFDWNDRVIRGKTKGAKAQLTPDGNKIFSIVTASNRPLGRFTFIKDEDHLTLSKRHVIEREFYPFELTIEKLVKYAKNKGIKFILW